MVDYSHVHVDEALGKLMWLVRAPAVTGRLETSFLTPVQVGKTLYINRRDRRPRGTEDYCYAEGRIGGADGPIAVEAASHLYYRSG